MVRRRETIEEQMARAQQDKKAATVRTSASSRGVRTRSRSATAMLIASVLAALWAAVMLTGAGQKAYAYGFFFTEFFAGVISLVALSLTVMLGLLATDRLVLRISHRVLMQSAHRATGVLGVAGSASTSSPRSPRAGRRRPTRWCRSSAAEGSTSGSARWPPCSWSA